MKKQRKKEKERGEECSGSAGEWVVRSVGIDYKLEKNNSFSKSSHLTVTLMTNSNHSLTEAPNHWSYVAIDFLE